MREANQPPPVQRHSGVDAMPASKTKEQQGLDVFFRCCCSFDSFLTHTFLRISFFFGDTQIQISLSRKTSTPSP